MEANRCEALTKYTSLLWMEPMKPSAETLDRSLLNYKYYGEFQCHKTTFLCLK